MMVEPRACSLLNPNNFVKQAIISSLASVTLYRHESLRRSAETAMVSQESAFKTLGISQSLVLLNQRIL